MKKIFSIAVSVIAAAIMGTTNANATSNALVAKNVKTATSTEVHDKKGKLIYSVKRYDESQLNKEVRSLVRSQYYDFNIIGVEEVVIPGTEKSVYMIHLQDDTHIKIVKVFNGEMEVTGDYVRG